MYGCLLRCGAKSRTLPTFPRAILAAIRVFTIQPMASFANSFLFSCHGYERYAYAKCIVKIIRIFRKTCVAIGREALFHNIHRAVNN